MARAHQKAGCILQGEHRRVDPNLEERPCEIEILASIWCPVPIRSMAPPKSRLPVRRTERSTLFTPKASAIRSTRIGRPRRAPSGDRLRGCAAAWRSNRSTKVPLASTRSSNAQRSRPRWNAASASEPPMLGRRPPRAAPAGALGICPRRQIVHLRCIGRVRQRRPRISPLRLRPTSTMGRERLSGRLSPGPRASALTATRACGREDCTLTPKRRPGPQGRGPSRPLD